MRWSLWLGACVLSTFALQAPCSGEGDQASQLGACGAAPEVRECLAAADRPWKLSNTRLRYLVQQCERAWLKGGDEAVAVVGARVAWLAKDDDALWRWERRAKPTIAGARILHIVSDMQRRNGDLDGAEVMLRRALELQVNRDFTRAANTALSLLDLVQSTKPPRESIAMARIAWEQADIAKNATSMALAEHQLVKILVDLGELSTAASVIEHTEASGLARIPALHDAAKGWLEAARGRPRAAISLLRRASQVDPHIGNGELLQDAIAIVHVLVGEGQTAEARRELERARSLMRQGALRSLDNECRLAAAEASVELAEGEIAAALASVERGLAIRSRDAARVALLNVQGDALARRGDLVAAERAWRAAADSIEVWRESIPVHRLRSGLVARHRHALESWLDSAGLRGDAAEAFRVAQRILGRELLDRIRQREANAPATVDDSVRGVEQRLAAWDRDAAIVGRPVVRELTEVPHDMIAIMFGARSVWAIRKIAGRVSIDRLGDRAMTTQLVDAYRRAIDDPDVAAALGGALFPEAALPGGRDARLLVMLDRELSDVALAGLRVGGAYLVERVGILEVLSPELLFAGVPHAPCGTSIAVGDPHGDLAGAVDEMHAVANTMGARVFLGTDATSEAIRHGSGACILHIATHSSIEDGRAAFVLAGRALSATDIVNDKIAPRLAVIATCRSQVDDRPEASLVAAFLAAGAPGVIGVKRSYEDVDGKLLMLEFYQRYHLGGERDPLLALVQAQRSAIASRMPPRAWATVSFFGAGGWIN